MVPYKQSSFNCAQIHGYKNDAKPKKKIDKIQHFIKQKKKNIFLIPRYRPKEYEICECRFDFFQIIHFKVAQKIILKKWIAIIEIDRQIR